VRVYKIKFALRFGCVCVCLHLFAIVWNDLYVCECVFVCVWFGEGGEMGSN
jgi:hypothetical protein